MGLKHYDDMNLLQRDAVREVGSIGTAHAVTALSQLWVRPLQWEFLIFIYWATNEIIRRMGNPEETVAGLWFICQVN